MSLLEIEGLRVRAGGREVIAGIDLRVASGETHAVMGPNGSGKSTLAHALMGRPGAEITGGSIRIDGVELVGLEPWERAKAGLYLALQYPVEVPGVALADVVREALVAAGKPSDGIEEQIVAESARLGIAAGLVSRHLNVELSGGEKKRNETLQLVLLQPRFAVLDELDSGLDVDALRQVAKRIEEVKLASAPPLGVVAITHYRRLLDELAPDVVHVLSAGRIVRSGPPELATELEETGYAGYRQA
ncbi:MAG: Fe-S cluster assembly ATPase SufC [Acidimicrobiales bacterium]